MFKVNIALESIVLQEILERRIPFFLLFSKLFTYVNIYTYLSGDNIGFRLNLFVQQYGWELDSKLRRDKTVHKIEWIHLTLCSHPYCNNGQSLLHTIHNIPVFSMSN